MVCSSGPYSYIRHPGYTGGIIWSLGTGFVLSSPTCIALDVVRSVILVVRTVFEDKTLQEELSGYKGYAKRVPYKLVPYIW